MAISISSKRGSFRFKIFSETHAISINNFGEWGYGLYLVQATMAVMQGWEEITASEFEEEFDYIKKRINELK